MPLPRQATTPVIPHHHHILGLSKITFLLIASMATLQGTTSLQLVNVTVPRYAELNSSVALGCHFDLSGNTLYSVKWYKDDHEFYRYMPSYEPKSLVFPQIGINLDDQRSGMNQVTLRRVSFNSTGAYRCEVSTEAPNFETVVSTETMIVRALPKERPVITGLQQVYSSGDVIKANCSSPRSNPIASLTWFVNGVLMDRFSLDYYLLPVDEEGLSEATLGLNVRVEMALFPAGGPLELRCTATVLERTWERTAHVNLARLSNQMLAQDPGNASVALGLPSLMTFALMTFLLLWNSRSLWCS